MKNMLTLQLLLCVTPQIISGSGTSTTATCRFRMETMVAIDFSKSYLKVFSDLEGTIIDISSQLLNLFPRSTIGLASFVDKPIKPLGWPPQGNWFMGDYCLKVHEKVGLTPEQFPEAVAKFTGSPAGGGGDWPENQLGVLYDLAVNETLAGWTPINDVGTDIPVVRTIVMFTDSAYHIAGDAKKANLVPIDGHTATDCLKVDYPSVYLTGSALKRAHVNPIFFLYSKEEDLIPVYDELLQNMEIAGFSKSISGEKQKIQEQFHGAINSLSDHICNQKTIDVVWSQDVTYSFTDDLDVFHTRIDEWSKQLQQQFVGARFGLTSYGDKPISPFGHKPSSDYCYRLESPLSTDPSKAINAAKALEYTSGRDWKESQLDAIISSVKDKLGWRTETQWNGFHVERYLVVTTDSPPHEAGDAAAKMVNLAKHSGGIVACESEDFPSVAQVGKALQDAKVKLVFVTPAAVYDVYSDILKQLKEGWGISGKVVLLDDPSGSILDTLPQTIRHLSSET